MERVAKGFIIPIPGANGRPAYYKIVDAEEGENMLRDLVGMMRRLLEDYTNGGKDRIGDAQGLNAYIDALVFYLKGLLYFDPVPGVVLSPQLALYYYSKPRVRIPDVLEPPYTREGLKRYIQSEDVIKLIPEAPSNRLFADNVRNRLFECLMFPADTRPGSNTSSLLLHLLLVSAISSCIFIEENYNPQDNLASFMGNPETQLKIAVLRLLSIFHDIGKFNIRRWHEHHKVSAETLYNIFKDFIEGEAEEIVDKAAKLISGEKIEGYEELRRMVREADKIASNIDRVQTLFPKALSQSLRSEFEGKLEEYCREKGVGREEALWGWDFWEALGFEMTLRLTEDYCRNMSSMGLDNPIFTTEGRRVTEKLRISRLDVAGIQRFIRSNKLPALVGGSRIVDLAVYVSIPSMLTEKFRLPAETVISYGGGNITLILPSQISNTVLDGVVETAAKELDIRLNYGSSPIYDTIFKVNTTIDKEISISKFTSGWGKLSPNIYMKCKWCQSEYASQQEEQVCEKCLWKKNVGYNYHFKWKCRYIGLEWSDRLGEKMLEYIAGVERDRLGEVSEYPAMAVVRFDGNMMSQLIASSTSITDMVERSIRVDRSIKEAFRSFLTQLKNISIEDWRRTVLGMMYMGGDDGTVILPSYLTVQFALHMASNYYRQMGYKSTLSFGIAVGKPKHPIIPLYDSAGYLLDEIAKRGSREKAYEIHKSRVDEPSSTFRGAIAFYTADGGVMTPDSLEHVMTIEYNSGMSSQLKKPYTLSSKGNPDSILRLLEMIIQHLDLSKAEEPLTTIGILKGEKRLRDLRNSILDVMHTTLIGDTSIRIKILHAKRQEERGKPYTKEMVKNLLCLDQREQKLRFNLIDQYHIIKILGGGL